MIRKYFARLLFAVSAVLFLTVTCTKDPPKEDPPKEHVITMTTMASKVRIDVWITLSAGNDSLAVDWGDGNISYIDSASFSSLYPSTNRVGFSFSHNYSGASEHHITIIANNIYMLDCSKNQLTNLDVSGNTTLISLKCKINPLTTLDLSNCTALENLNANDCSLTALDVSTNTALTDLYVRYNQFTILNVSKNKKLRRLDCIGNKLTKLDFKNNTELRILACGNNLLTATAINDMFRTLPNRTDDLYGVGMDVYGNPGAYDCDYSIAEKKGWMRRHIGPSNMEDRSNSIKIINIK